MRRQTVELQLSSGAHPVQYFDRQARGATGLFVHVLGNAAANFEELTSEPALAGYRLGGESHRC